MTLFLGESYDSGMARTPWVQGREERLIKSNTALGTCISLHHKPRDHHNRCRRSIWWNPTSTPDTQRPRLMKGMREPAADFRLAGQRLNTSPGSGTGRIPHHRVLAWGWQTLLWRTDSKYSGLCKLNIKTEIFYQYLHNRRENRIFIEETEIDIYSIQYVHRHTYRVHCCHYYFEQTVIY